MTRRLVPSPGSLVVAVLGLVGLGFGVAAQVNAASGRSASRVTPVVAAVNRAAPAVVNVTTDLGATGPYTRERGIGAGVIVHPEGYVVTNSHVVNGAQRVWVSLSHSTGGQAYEARVLESDPSHDLALLRIGGGPFPYVALCSTCDVMVGEVAIAIGNPYGLGDTVTQGIISAKGRSATFSTGQVIKNLIQTDASISQGNSGGALLNVDGELIGINAAVHANAHGIAFTVPADDVQRMLDRNLGAAARPPAPSSVPVTLPDASRVAKIEPSTPVPAPTPAPRAAAPAPASRAPSSRTPLGLTLQNGVAGILVSAVAAGSNADIAGLQSGDTIQDIDGKPASTPSDLATTFRGSPSGKSYVLGVRRGEKRVSAIVVVP
jgi:S1-C subfamily serine protease